jgi:hypothetical protein
MEAATLSLEARPTSFGRGGRSSGQGPRESAPGMEFCGRASSVTAIRGELLHWRDGLSRPRKRALDGRTSDGITCKDPEDAGREGRQEMQVGQKERGASIAGERCGRLIEWAPRRAASSARRRRFWDQLVSTSLREVEVVKPARSLPVVSEGSAEHPRVRVLGNAAERIARRPACTHQN